MPDALTRLWGAISLALGIICIYGGYANKKVFGNGGIIVTALTTGKLTNVASIPPLSFHTAVKQPTQTTTTATTYPTATTYQANV